jgi:hypothetical protein
MALVISILRQGWIALVTIVGYTVVAIALSILVGYGRMALVSIVGHSRMGLATVVQERVV